MPAPRRFSATLPERERPSLRRRVLRVSLFLLAVLALTWVALRTFRVPTEPVRAERMIPVR
jgi:hypothetical protein